MFPKISRPFLADRIFKNHALAYDLYVKLAKTIPLSTEADWELDDLEECDFAGYASKLNPAFEAATLDGTDRGKIISPELIWTAGSIEAAQTIKAVYTTFAAGGTEYLIDVQQLSPTVTLAEAGQEFKRKLTFYINNFAV